MKRPPPSHQEHSNHQESADENADYKVGYGRPPKHTQFKKGRSGNPNGRPRRQCNVRTVVKEALGQKIIIREGGETRTMTKFDGIVLTTVNEALKGNHKAQNYLLTLMRSTGMIAEEEQANDNEPLTAFDQELIADFIKHNVPENPNGQDNSSKSDPDCPPHTPQSDEGDPDDS